MPISIISGITPRRTCHPQAVSFASRDGLTFMPVLRAIRFWGLDVGLAQRTKSQAGLVDYLEP